MVAGHRRMMLPFVGTVKALTAASVFATVRIRDEGAEWREWKEANRRRYQYPYDDHVETYHEHNAAMVAKARREERERLQREKDAVVISAAEAKRQRKQERNRLRIHNASTRPSGEPQTVLAHTSEAEVNPNILNESQPKGEENESL